MKDSMTNYLEDLKAIEGFPIAEDDELVSLSDPPHFTIYPNPYVQDFALRHSESQSDENNQYHREPFIGDVSAGKNDPIYNAHSYHTKVPYKAIMPFIEHYTDPGDVVLDSFCGTGMTGVAAQLTGRLAVLGDLSPAATFIAYNYNAPVDVEAFEQAARNIVSEVMHECGWMYRTWHPNFSDDNRIDGQINFTIWSDVFSCPYCGFEFTFWDIAVDQKTGKVKREFPCRNCDAGLNKRILNRSTQTMHSEVLGREITFGRQEPVLIDYSVGRRKYQKYLDSADRELISRIDQQVLPYWFPTTRIDRDLDLWYERDYRQLGVYSVDSFFTKRNLWILAAFWDKASRIADKRIREAIRFGITGMQVNLSKMNRWRANVSFPYNPLSGTLYLGALQSESNVIVGIENKFARLAKAFHITATFNNDRYRITTQSAAGPIAGLNADSIDYIFTDPPFGSNIIYSDLSIIWESWLKSFTNSEEEAVVHRRKKIQPSTLDDYRLIMTQCFTEMHRVLKPGRWITVVFHNTKASVWNAIQDSLSRSGFIVAQVAVLDKKQGSFKQVTAPGAVKNDLVINAYKPGSGFEESFLKLVGVGMERNFVAQHLEMLPIAANVERTREMLYSKLLAYYVQRGYEINMDSSQFYRFLESEFVERDGYWFQDEAKVQSYERDKLGKSKNSSVPLGQGILFITDERSALAWLNHFLSERAKTYSEIYTAYTKVLQASDDQIPEPQQLLEENFLQARDLWKRPDAVTGEELENRRRSRLLRQFEEYLSQAKAGRELMDVRKEAIIVGFEQAYRGKQFEVILAVGEKLNQSLIDSSTEIFDFMDIAEAKLQR